METTTQNTGAKFSLFQNLVHSNDFKPDFVWGAATSAYQACFDFIIYFLCFNYRTLFQHPR